MEFTGERFVPETHGEIELEHLHRYLLACEIVAGKAVLDIASGEGYGSAMMAKTAASVIGVDISAEAIEHANTRYLQENLKFLTGTCSAIPLRDASVDIVVSFETIEHHNEHEQMMSEIRRVLRPEGVLFISSPDKQNYSIEPDFTNEFHVKELFEQEFKDLLESHFQNTQYFGQRIIYGSGILTDAAETMVVTYKRDDWDVVRGAGLTKPIYWVAIASNGPLPAVPSGIFEESIELVLARKDNDWGIRVENTAADFRREIDRIVAERDQMLVDKDISYQREIDLLSTKLVDKDISYQREIDLLSTKLVDKDISYQREIDLLSTKLVDKDISYQREIDLLSTKYEQMLASSESMSVRLSHFTPKVSVVIVNYNGKHFLDNLLKSIKIQTEQPAEVIIVDNASTDGSVDYLREHYSWVKVIQSKENLGFAEGNNVGVRAASSALIALLNNDAIAEPQWLEYLLESWVDYIGKGVPIGAVSPKIRYLTKFLNIQISSDTSIANGNDGRPLGIAVDLNETRILDCDYIKPLPQSGFHNEENWPNQRIVRWTNGTANLLLPIEDLGQSSPVLRITSARPGGLMRTTVTISCEGTLLGEFVSTADFQSIDLRLPDTIHEKSFWVLNNAGSTLDERGNAADIGINQRDLNQFDQVKSINAFCGCSLLFERKVFLALNGFDERFFMYYEDADLAWRMRKAGLYFAFDARSIVRHIHAGSSIEWSPSFRYHVTRNQRLIALKNAPAQAIPKLIISLAKAYLRGKKTRISNDPSRPLNELTSTEIEHKAIYDAARLAPQILVQRALFIVK
ncbi:hypothetical protein CR155_18485 [Pollutimonas nitritireducens]|uniref:Glycosyltransferase n=1 Tax=Pollutimonas nitritireducens TaxID=2045209 RepID=A0A2N4UBT4_9BURK|nr:methyltransferase domain-containing protein [Pollutimonas nitritireducens]PLC52484.1 hypothetical protein CR155_18485 [Pollutimonas nitritireducens]